MARWSAQGLIDLVLDDGSFESWDQPIDISGHSEGYQSELRAAAERAGTDESVLTGRGLVRGRPGGRRGQRVRLPRRLDRPGSRPADRRVRAPRDRGGAARARDHRLRRDPDAGGDAGVLRDGGDLARRDGSPCRGTALPRAPAPPDHRWRLRVVGLARPRDRRRARCARRLPRAQGVRGARGAPVPVRCPAGRAPRRAGGDRRGGVHRGPSRAARPDPGRARGPCGPAGAAAAGRTPPPRAGRSGSRWS